MTAPRFREYEKGGIRRLSHASTNRRVFELIEPSLRAHERTLDLGAGEGYFARELGTYLRDQLNAEPTAILRACDTEPGQFRYEGIRCDRIADDGTLPYEDGAFGMICSVEVIEHVEDQFKFAREAFRVLRKGGSLVMTTPNVLNMNSRLRTLHSGFPLLFNPLELERHDRVHTSGHIHPVSFYYLAYLLRAAGFVDIEARFDHRKRSAVFQAALFSPLILLGHLAFVLKMYRRHQREMVQNRELVRAMNSFDMLTSRSIIVSARRPRGG